MQKHIITFLCFFILNKNIRRRIRKDLLNDYCVLNNVFKKKNNKKVLISYVKTPFMTGLDVVHTQATECYSAANIFDKLGYNVDVIGFNEIKESMNYNDYDIIYGFGESLEKSFIKPDVKASLKRIVYGTGCSVDYANKNGLKRLVPFDKKHKTNASCSLRFANFTPHQLYLSDCIIALGNKFSANTYRNEYMKSTVCSLPLFYFNTVKINLENKNFTEAKKNFLWFGSAGALHKGLDLCIEYFKKHPELTLHICGIPEREKEFFRVYNKELNNKVPNIINHGFINIKGEVFKNLMQKCGFAIYPTVSEGGSPGLLTVMGNGGLIPITTEACSLDIDHLGFIMKEPNEKELEEQMKKVLKLSDKKTKELSVKVKKEISEHYTLEKYKNSLEKIIKKAIKNK